jgi:Cu-Zn family superoxide dismutase
MKSFRTVSLLVCSLAVASFALADHHHDMKLEKGATAVAHLKPAKDSKVEGTVQFIPTDKGVRVVARVSNLTPGLHGFHVHEKGDLSAPDLSSAGGHFNPEKHQHAAREATQRHLGDLGNIDANSSGVAEVDYVDTQLKLDGADSIIGRSVIVHQKADDLKSQPSGDAGGRIAGGIIEAVKH